MVKLATRSRDVNVATARCAHAHIIVRDRETGRASSCITAAPARFVAARASVVVECVAAVRSCIELG